MKRWAVLTVLLNLLILAALALPLLMVCLGPGASKGGDSLTLHEAVQVFANPGFWVWLFVLGLAQAILLLVPVARAEGRPIARRNLVFPIVTASFLFANLLFFGVLSLIVVFWHDAGLEPLAMLGKHFAPEQGGWAFVCGGGIVFVVFWAGWALVFYQFCNCWPSGRGCSSFL